MGSEMCIRDRLNTSGGHHYAQARPAAEKVTVGRLRDVVWCLATWPMGQVPSTQRHLLVTSGRETAHAPAPWASRCTPSPRAEACKIGAGRGTDAHHHVKVVCCRWACLCISRRQAGQGPLDFFNLEVDPGGCKKNRQRDTRQGESDKEKNSARVRPDSNHIRCILGCFGSVNRT